MTLNKWNDFKGAAKRIEDIDLPRIGAKIGVGEDVMHAVLDVESRGHGFDEQGRPVILFEPHIFYRMLQSNPAKQRKAVEAGVAYPKWRRGYPKDSYPRLHTALAIDETAALKSASWGLGQVMGFNFASAGYPSVQKFVRAMMEDEDKHLEAMVDFIINNNLDDELRRRDWAGFARGYNGPGYAKNNYHTRLAKRYAWWKKQPDTPWNPDDAAFEEEHAETLPPAEDPIAGTEVVAVPEVPKQVDEEVKKKTGRWGWLTSIFGGGGVGAGFMFGMPWQGIVAIVGGVLVLLIVIVLLRKQIISAVGDIRKAVEA